MGLDYCVDALPRESEHRSDFCDSHKVEGHKENLGPRWDIVVDLWTGLLTIGTTGTIVDRQ